MLLTPAELSSRLGSSDLIVFDCRHDLLDHQKGRRAYESSHLPTARFAEVESNLAGTKTGKNGRHPLPSPESFVSFLESQGVSDSTSIVAYDDAGGLYAARLWWMARWVGLTRTFLLDGGLTAWLAEGRPVTDVEPELPTPGQITRRPVTPTVEVDELLKGLGSPGQLVLDARAAERYRGDTETIDPVAGHIPGALNRFYRLNLDSDLRFKSRDQVRREFETLLQGRSPADVVHQCGSGITACANLFAMEYAGLTGSRLYAGSWSEWVSDPARPVSKGAQA